MSELNDKLISKDEKDNNGISWLDDIYKDFKSNNAKELLDKIESIADFNNNTVDRVVIYPVQDREELESLYLKYMALSKDDKIESNSKAKTVFGKSNKELYTFIKDNIIKSKNNDIKDTYTDNKKVEKKDNNNSLFTNDLPMLTPKELTEKLSEDFSIIESENTTLNKWLQKYILLGYGIKTEDYNILNLERINILRKAIYKNDEETILRCGWIPGVEFNSENRVKASQIVKSKLEKPNIIDYDLLNESYIEEASNNNKKTISIVFVTGSSILAKSIRKVQGTEFSHASISLDDDLSKIYSFNMRNGFNGLTYESVKNYIKEGVTKMGVYTFLVSEKVYNNLEKALDNFNLYINKTKYSILNLLTIPVNIPLDIDMKMVCSEFVDKLLKMANLDLTNKKSSLVGPKDLIHAVNTKYNIVEVFNGDPKKFNHKEIEKRIKKIKKSNLAIYEFVEYINERSINEVKEFPLQFDQDANLFIKNIKKINFDHEYNVSHVFLKSYAKVNNIEGMKYELAKLFSLNILLENRIYNSKFHKKDREKYINIRTKILKDFNKYLDIILEKDSDFIFSIYYDKSPFSDTFIKINNPTLKHASDLIKYVFSEEYIEEAKSIPIQFDKDGNLILKNLRKINFEQEYSNSHRLLVEYDKTNSYEPMKFELAKMQFFITLLEKKIYKEGKDKSVNELKVRARFLNDFKKYLKIVNNNDPSFNFTEYYEQSPFNDALLKIDKDTLKYGFKALKYIIKG